jgi:hypothetical protein
MLFMCKCNEGVHYQCLRNWMQYKIIAKQNTNVTSYQWKKLDCEICLTKWPRHIRFKGLLNELISVEKPSGPFIMMEKLQSEQNQSTSMHIITPTTTTEIKIGRGHMCEFRIADISVSRTHSIIKYENENFFIFDNDSKFGTLILLRKPYQIKFDKAALQIGRTVFTFVLK